MKSEVGSGSTITCIVFIVCLTIVLLAAMESIDKAAQRKQENKLKKGDETE